MLANVNKFLRLSRFRHGNKMFASAAALSLPAALFVAALSSTCTAVVFAAIVLALAYLQYAACTTPRSKDNRTSLVFFAWLASSIVTLALLFHVFVVDLLEILFEEDLVLIVLIGASLTCLYHTKLKANQFASLARGGDVEAAAPAGDKQLKALLAADGGGHSSNAFCLLCQAYIPSQGGHCLWLDCCIGRSNKKYYVLGVIFGLLALFYGTNLTLTTVCHPFVFLKTILLPDDCSDVYFQYNIAICFVTGLYGLLMSFVLSLYFSYELLQYIHRLLFGA